MGKNRHSKESIIQTLQNLAKRLNKESLSTHDVQSVISRSAVDYHFGSLGNALEAAGLQRRTAWEHLKDRQRSLSEDELFGSMAEVEGQLGHEPKLREYAVNGKYSEKPFTDRFGKWSDVLAYYRKWKSSKTFDLAEVNPNGNPGGNAVVASSPIASKQKNVALTRSGTTPAQLYGEPIDFRGLRHAPINEQGVVYLFGMVSRELGFYVEAVQQGFPDCEGKYLYEAKKNLWAKARIEFEFRASNFQEHGHDSSQCDFIVCWINDWQDCPITVIELKHEILKLPQ